MTGPEMRPFVVRRRPPEDMALTAERERSDARLVEQLGCVIRDAKSLEDAGSQILAIAEAKRIGADLLAEMAASAALLGAAQNSPEGKG